MQFAIQSRPPFSPRVHPPIRQSSRTSDERSAPDPIGKPSRCEQDDTEPARDSGCGRLRKPKPSIRFATYRRANALDTPGGVDAPDGGVSCDPTRIPARRRHSASRVRWRVIALPFPAPRPGVRGPASPTGRLPHRTRRRTPGRTSATPRIKHSGTCARSADNPGRGRGQAGGRGNAAQCVDRSVGRAAAGTT